MTTQQLYQKTLNEQVSKQEFLNSVRKDPQYYNVLTNVMSFDDTIKVLKGKGYIWEASEEGSNIKPIDFLGSFKALNESSTKKQKLKGGKGDNLVPDQVNYYEFRKGWKHELEHTDDIDKAKEIALDHLAEDPMYYTRLEMIETKAKKKQRTDLPIDISKKKASVKDEANQMTPISKKKEKSNVADNQNKKEKARSKSAGVKKMKGGSGEMKSIKESYIAENIFSGMEKYKNMFKAALDRRKKRGPEYKIDKTAISSKPATKEYPQSGEITPMSTVDIIKKFKDRKDPDNTIIGTFKLTPSKGGNPETINLTYVEYKDLMGQQKNTKNPEYKIETVDDRAKEMQKKYEAEPEKQKGSAKIFQPTPYQKDKEEEKKKSSSITKDFTKEPPAKQEGRKALLSTFEDDEEFEVQIKRTSTAGNKRPERTLDTRGKLISKATSSTTKPTTTTSEGLVTKTVLMNMIGNVGNSVTLFKPYPVVNTDKSYVIFDKEQSKLITKNFITGDKVELTIIGFPKESGRKKGTAMDLEKLKDLKDYKFFSVNPETKKAFAFKDKESADKHAASNKNKGYEVVDKDTAYEKGYLVNKSGTATVSEGYTYYIIEQEEKKSPEETLNGLKSEDVTFTVPAQGGDSGQDQVSNVVKTVKHLKDSNEVILGMTDGAILYIYKDPNGSLAGSYFSKDFKGSFKNEKSKPEYKIIAFGAKLEDALNSVYKVEESNQEILEKLIREQVRKALKEGEEGFYIGSSGPEVIKKKLEDYLKRYSTDWKTDPSPEQRSVGAEYEGIISKLVKELDDREPDLGTKIYKQYTDNKLDSNQADQATPPPSTMAYDPTKLVSRGGRIAESEPAAGKPSPEEVKKVVSAAKRYNDKNSQEFKDALSDLQSLISRYDGDIPKEVTSALMQMSDINK